MSTRFEFREKTAAKKINKEALQLLKTSTLSRDPDRSLESDLLLRLMKSHGPREAIINSFNHWLDRNINLQLSARPIDNKDGFTKLSNIRVEPYADTLGAKYVLRTPQYCRDNKHTYEGIIVADATFHDYKETEGSKFNPLSTENLTQRQKVEIQSNKKAEKIILGKIPIMVRSKYCMTNGLSDGQRLNLGECTNDYGGYFIIAGGEKTIISQEKLRTGEYILWNDDETGKIECIITVVTDSGTTVVSLIPGTKWTTLKVGIHYIGKDKHIPLYVAFKFLGYNIVNATDLISRFIPYHLRQAAMLYLQSSIVRTQSIGTNYIGYITMKKNKQKGGTKSYVENEKEITKAIRQNLFSNITSLHGKAKALAFMAAQIILASMNERPLNNRDSYGLKKIHTPGKLMEIKLNTIWSDILKKINNDVSATNYSTKGIKGFVSLMNNYSSNISADFDKSFLQSWKIKNGQVSESVTDMLKRDTPAAAISQITRIVAPSSVRGKKSIIREVNQAQLGGVCIAETPEGETCLTENAMVHLGDGKKMSIKDIQIGDIVQYYSFHHKRYLNTSVTKKFQFMSKDNLFRITTDDGQVIEATIEHPFFTENGWTSVGELNKENHKILMIDNKTVKYANIKSIEKIEDTIVYDITIVADAHNFIANNFITHNCGLVKNLGLSASVSLDRDTNVFFTLMRGEMKNYEKFIPTIKGKKIPYEWNEHVYVLDSEDPNLASILKPDTEDYEEIIVETDKFANETEDDYKIRKYLIREEKINETFPYPIFINGILCAWCKDSEIEKTLLICRRFGLLPIDCCIFFNNYRKCLEIDTTAGRIIRPLLIVENGKLLIDELDAWEYDVDTLLTNGCMMYVDLKEQEKIMIAQNTDEIRNLDNTIQDLRNIISEKEKIVKRLRDSLMSMKRDENSIEEDISKDRDYVEMMKFKQDLNEMITYPYTHSELHPISQYGNLAGMIPMANKTQGPRITYQASMGKQALNQYHTMHYQRFDTSFKVMTSPSLPIFQSEITIPNGLTIMPSGDTLIRCIYAHPDNPEDGIVFNRDALRTGKLRIDKYITISLLFKNRNDIEEKRGRPRVISPGDLRYHAIEENGLPTLDSYLKEGDCVIGRSRIFLEGRNIGKEVNASSYIGIGEEGYVDRIAINKTSKGVLVKIKLRQSRQQIEGDKLATRYSQKGTISKIEDPKNLPRVASGPNKGMYGDVYVNPHAIPSRMPMGEQQEMLTSKAAIYHGSRVDSTTFNDLNDDSKLIYAQKILQERWDKYERENPNEPKEDVNGQQYGTRFAEGYEDMEVPIRIIPHDKPELKGQGPKYLVPSGKYRPCKKPIFMAPCYTQVLKHHVLDKFQMRSIGSIDPTSHQPIGGRARAGGQRVGEMENHAMISHGATSLILERLMYVSDLFEAVICARCGHFALANNIKNIYKCGVCKTSNSEDSDDKGEFGRIQFPFVFKYLIYLLQFAMIDVTFNTVPVSEYGTGNLISEDQYVV